MFTQYVQCATRGTNRLDQDTVPLPHLALSDHLSLLLIPAYTPVRRQTKPIKKCVKTWQEAVLFQLQDCFAKTDRDIVKQQYLQDFTDSTLPYVRFCTDGVAIDKNVWFYPNCNP